ncbi:zinc transport system permease protein [Actinopolyspora mzabensis]|uniref:Zinc transport system permease protein n=1 Tax=Actinopolyspora mzabensis TaxID=995066 RepID=A0A1G9EI29_ACTMZ|nr:metal ABC transporter permease [Actinopolyspora mzabensis]SDK75827.1 zinc transport system permease protein [Actinopolyspora mzabensis]
MIEALRLEFMQNAVTAAVLASVVLGVVGSLVVVNREVLVGGGIAHASYGGVGLGFLLGLDPAVTAMLFGVVAAVIMGVLRRYVRQRNDTLIGMLWAVGMSLGVVFVQLTPGYTANARSFLFGSLLSIPRGDLPLLGAVAAVLVGFVVLYYRPLLVHSFDRDFALSRNLPVFPLELVLLAAIALAVVVLIQLVGVVLLIALLTIPAATAGLFTRTLASMMTATVAVGVLVTLGGLSASYTFDLPSGPAVVLTACVVFIVVRGVFLPMRGLMSTPLADRSGCRSDSNGGDPSR